MVNKRSSWALKGSTWMFLLVHSAIMWSDMTQRWKSDIRMSNHHRGALLHCICQCWSLLGVYWACVEITPGYAGLWVLEGRRDSICFDLLPSDQIHLALRQCGVGVAILGPGWGHAGELVLLGEQDLLVLVADPHQFGDALADEVNHLADTHEDAQQTGCDHEQHEDLFLRWTTDEAVHSVGTWLQWTLGQPARKVQRRRGIQSLPCSCFLSGMNQALPGQVISVIYPVENVKKRRIESGF